MASLYLLHVSGRAQQISALVPTRSFLSAPPPKPYPDVACFRDDEFLPPTEHSLLDNPSIRVRYSPWAVDGNGKPSARLRDPSGGSGGGKRGDNDGDDGGGGDGGGDEDGEEAPFLLSLLTIALTSFHLGYCAAVWMKDEALSFNFVSTALALFSLLSVAAIRLNERTGIDAYILGLGASVGVMMWTGERCLARREGSPAGIVALFSTFMAVLFSTALFHHL